jgi:hypothetical protein
MENDMDTLDGVSDEEKQTAVAIWAMANSTMYLCGDLAKFNNFAKTAFKMMSSSLSIPFGHFTQQNHRSLGAILASATQCLCSMYGTASTAERRLPSLLQPFLDTAHAS